MPETKKPYAGSGIRTGLLSILAAFGLAACNSSPDTTSYDDPQATIIPLLKGEAASNEVRFLEYIRHLPKKAAFERRTFADPKNSSNQLKYLLFKPKGFQPEQSYPLVLSLHGGAPRRHFEDLVEPYLPGLAYGLGRFVSDETQDKHPCFVLAPWSNEKNWDEENIGLIMALLASLEREFHIDTNRIYVTGQSMGGWGTWSIITDHPETFAAAVPICGGGEPGRAGRAKNIPIWAFHGTADQVVPVGYTRQMIAALNRAGSKPLYWEYKDADHAGTAERAYCEPELVEWLFAQRKP